MTERVAGLVLAAGSGSRFGTPKALVGTTQGSTWVARAVEVLRDGGCPSTYVVVGAEADRVRAAVPPAAQVVVADSWSEGMGASLRAGLAAVGASETAAPAVLVMLVDTLGVTAGVVGRLLAGSAPGALARATYDGDLGHPVLIGRDHWSGVIESAVGDRGARAYLAAHAVDLVECGDLGSGADIDTRAELATWLGE